MFENRVLKLRLVINNFYNIGWIKSQIIRFIGNPLRQYGYLNWNSWIYILSNVLFNIKRKFKNLDFVSIKLYKENYPFMA